MKAKATFVQSLLSYDGPQVALFKFGKSEIYLIGVAVEKDGMDCPFFVAAVTKYNWRRYLEGKVDLFYLFENAAARHRYFLDLATVENNQIALTKATEQDVKNPDLWPDRGFFSTYHNEVYKDSPQFDNDIQKFKIDGVWEAADFSGFYGKVSDVYAIFFLRDLFSNDDVSQAVKDAAREAVVQRLWRGGASYKGFYGTLGDSVPSMSRLRVNKIQYASPGTIELRGREDIFESMLLSLDSFEETSSAASEAYSDINKILSKEKLKKAGPNSTFSALAITDIVLRKCHVIYREIGFNDGNDFFEICDKNPLVFSKLTLSIFRRLKGIKDFIEEGRIEPETPDAVAPDDAQPAGN